MSQSYPTSAFDYDLPADLIAQEPSGERGASRLLVVGGTADRLEDRRFADLIDLIQPGDLLVLNTSRVRHARFLGTRPSGAPAEVLLLHPAQGDRWVAMGTPGSAVRPGRRIHLGEDAFIETIAELPEGYREVRFVGLTAEAALNRFGRLPLPPYITRDPTNADEARYQTVYAEREGSVAAPTAGLHFTPDLLASLVAGGIRIARLDLAVGPGTFKPVDVADPARHPMHPEEFDIPESTVSAIRELRAGGGRLWAVGTTVVRALESAMLGDGTIQAGRQETRLLITPGFRFRVVDRLITNFHLPRSTLLMLVAAFGGYDRVMAAYRHAVKARYRFYSYGDAMAVEPSADS